MFMETAVSKVFGSADVKLESALKNPNQFREAVLFESLSELPTKKIQEFAKSPEAKFMLENGIITQDTIERLMATSESAHLKTTVCHIAKENCDADWDALVECRIQERRLINKLMEKYSEQAKPIAENARKEFIEKSIPEYFRA